MNTLNIDIETYSTIDIKKAGLYRYAQSEDFEILIFAYSINSKPVKVVNVAQGEVMPQNIINMLNDGITKLYAYNAAFEWYCLNQAASILIHLDFLSISTISFTFEIIPPIASILIHLDFLSI